MDLNIFSLRKIRRFTDRYRNFQDFLGDVLEGERSLTKKDELSIPEPFEVLDTIEDIANPSASRGSTPRRVEASVAALFDSLTNYFEAGLLLQTAPETGTRLREMFVAGRIFVSPQSTGELLRVAIPLIEPGAMMRARPRPFLQLVHLDQMVSLRTTSAFIMTPVTGWTVVLFCGRPHPWQVGFLERTRDVIMLALEPRIKKRGRFSRELVHEGGIAAGAAPSFLPNLTSSFQTGLSLDRELNRHSGAVAANDSSEVPFCEGSSSAGATGVDHE